MSSNALLWPSQGTKPEERLDKYKWLRLPSQGIAPDGIVSPPTGNLLLDIHPNASVAYSLRQLRTAYTGPAIRVKRTSDNTTQDIGFLLDGSLDVSSLTSFVGASDGLVTILYDQSENGINLDTQNDDSELPRIIISGTLQTSHDLPSLFFDGVNDVIDSSLLLSTPAAQLFVFSVWQKLNIADSPINFNLNSPESGGSVGQRVTVHAPINSGTIFWDAGSVDSDRVNTSPDFNDTLQHQYTFTKFAGSNNQKIKRDGVELASRTQGTSSTVLNKVALGAFGDEISTFFSHMQFQELVFYDIDISTSIEDIESNILDYWLGTFVLETVFPPLADTDYQFYKFYQIKQGEITEVNAGKDIRIEIFDTLGPGVLLHPNGNDIRAFDENGVPLIYQITDVDTLTGEFSVKVEIPVADNLTFIQLTFGNPTAIEDSGSLGGISFPAIFSTPLLTKDVPNLLVDHDNWFDANWKHRILFTVKPSKVPSTQTNFPILIHHTIPELFGESLDELRFVTNNGIQLDYEIQSFSTFTGELIAWILVPQLSDGTEIYLYYDNPLAVDEQNPSAVFGSEYDLVYHMNLSGSIVKDSTINNNDGDVVSAADTDGKIGRALFFDGINDTVRPTLNITNLGDWSISVWAIKEGIGTSNFVIDFQTDRTIIGVRVNDNFHVFDGAWHDTGIDATDKFHQITLTRNGATMKVYVDGILTNTISGTNLGGLLGIGADFNLGPNKYNGIIDELRISKIVRDNDWITTEFNNQNDPDSFFTISPKEELKVIVEVK